jgi:hypothetical protein
MSMLVAAHLCAIFNAPSNPTCRTSVLLVFAWRERQGRVNNKLYPDPERTAVMTHAITARQQAQAQLFFAATVEDTHAIQKSGQANLLRMPLGNSLGTTEKCLRQGARS